MKSGVVMIKDRITEKFEMMERELRTKRENYIPRERRRKR